MSGINRKSSKKVRHNFEQSSLTKIESLEARQMLSVTAADFVGTFAVGSVNKYSVTYGGTVEGTDTRTVVGTTTFNGYNNVKQIDTELTAVSGETSKSSNYFNLDTNGYTQYGNVDTGTNASGGVTSVDTQTDSPPQLAFPASLAANVPYTSSTTETSSDMITGESSPSTSSEMQSQTVTLTSDSTVSVTVPAGTYNAYLVDVSETDTPQDGTAGDTITTQEWLTPGIGIVKFITGSGTTADELDLTSTTDTAGGGGSGGGGGGTTTTGALNPLVVKTTYPGSVVAGGTAKGSATVSLTNNTGTKIKESVTTQVFASQDSAVDSASIYLGTFTKTVTVNVEGFTNVTVPIKSIPATLNGTYTLLASATDTAGTSSSTTGPTLIAAAPYVAFSNQVLTTNLTGSVVSGSKTKDTATLTLTNTGNIPSTGSTSVELLVSPDGTVASGTPIRTFPQSIVLQPGKSKTVKFALQTLPNVPNGTYQVVAELTDPKGNVTTVDTASTVSLAQPFLTLTPVLSAITPGAKGTGTVSLTVTNNGNIEPKGAAVVAFYASLTASAIGATSVSSSNASVPLQPGKSKTIKYHLTAAMMATIAADGVLVVTVTDPLGGVETASTAG